jgi:hypothetical protein
VDREPAADAGAEDHREHAGRAGGGAVGRLRECQAVGVVGERDRPLEVPLEVAIERPAVQPGRVRVL